METPKVIYLQTCGDCAGLDCATCNFDNLDEVTWCKEKINDSDAVYFSEEAVRKLLFHEYEQANNLIDFASCAKKTLKGGLIEVEKSVNQAIKFLKGETK